LACAKKRITMKKSFILLLIVVGLIGVNEAHAQRRSPNLNLGLQLAQPLGEFAAQYEGFPVGIGGSFSMPILRLPIEWGIGYAWNSMGSSDRDIVALINQDSINGNVYSEGTIAIRSTNSRYLAHARIRPLAGKIQPYGDVFAGLESYKTTTSITLDNSGYSSELSTNRDHLDMTYCFGWALGLRWRVAPGVYVEGRYENINGGKVKYVNDESISINNDNTIAFDLKESKTNKAVYQVGVAIGF
jgi:opacity protein-like surface antigen